MAIADNRLKQFFANQKVGAFDALKQSKKPVTPQNNSSNETQEKEIAPVAPQKIEQDIQHHTEQGRLDNLPPASPVKKSNYLMGNSNNIILKKATKPLAIREHFAGFPLANSNQPVSVPLADREQPASNPLAKALAQPLAKEEEILFMDLRDFSKRERELLTLIFWQCHNNCSLTSPPISTEEIRHTLKISPERVRNLIFRISKKGGIRVTQYKSGQSAYRVFELPKSLYQWMIDQQNNRAIRMVEPLAASLANPLAIQPLYSSSLLDNKKITTSLPEDWKKINFYALADLGFSETQLMQLYQSGNTNPQIVQESINLFAYSIEHNEKTKTYSDPLNVLMGVLRKGQKWNEPNYISPQDIALQQLIERKKKEKEKRDLMIKELVDMEFPTWRAKLTDNQIKLIVPEITLRTNITAAITAALKAHFVENILLQKLEQTGVVSIEQ